MSEREQNIVLNDEAVTEEAPKDRKGFVAWIKAHKKQLILVGISIPTITAVVLGLKNKDALKILWENLNEEIKKANMYSSKWFETVTDDVLSTEREKVGLEYCSSGDNFSEASRLQNLLGAVRFPMHQVFTVNMAGTCQTMTNNRKAPRRRN